MSRVRWTVGGVCRTAIVLSCVWCACAATVCAQSSAGQGPAAQSPAAQGPAAQGPAAQGPAAQSRRAALAATIDSHQRAQELRRRGIVEDYPELLDEARLHYSRAVDGYRALLDGGRGGRLRCELSYNLADALYWGERYEEAETDYRRVRDACPEFVSESGRRTVESVQRQMDEVSVEARAEAPEPTGQPPRVGPITMPPLVERLVWARDDYLAAVDNAHDQERVRNAYALNNARTLYRYGRWREARRRFARIYRVGCPDVDTSVVAEIAWEHLYRMAVALGEQAEANRLTTQMAEQPCARPRVAIDGCMDCGVHIQRYREGLDRLRDAEDAPPDQREAGYLGAAVSLLQTAMEHPEDPEGEHALMYAATAYERVQRWTDAATAYRLVIDRASRRPDEERAPADRESMLRAADQGLAVALSLTSRPPR